MRLRRIVETGLEVFGRHDSCCRNRNPAEVLPIGQVYPRSSESRADKSSSRSRRGRRRQKGEAAAVYIYLY